MPETSRETDPTIKNFVESALRNIVTTATAAFNALTSGPQPMPMPMPMPLPLPAPPTEPRPTARSAEAGRQPIALADLLSTIQGAVNGAGPGAPGFTMGFVPSPQIPGWPFDSGGVFPREPAIVQRVTSEIGRLVQQRGALTQRVSRRSEDVATLQRLGLISATDAAVLTEIASRTGPGPLDAAQLAGASSLLLQLIAYLMELAGPTGPTTREARIFDVDQCLSGASLGATLGAASGGPGAPGTAFLGAVIGCAFGGFAGWLSGE